MLGSRAVIKALQFHFAMYPNFPPLGFCGLGRGGGIRTHGPMLPKHVLIPPELHLDKDRQYITDGQWGSPHCFQYGVLHIYLQIQKQTFPTYRRRHITHPERSSHASSFPSTQPLFSFPNYYQYSDLFRVFPGFLQRCLAFSFYRED